MRELIARLEAATGPDRELDAAIAEAAGLHPERIGDALYETDGKPDWKGRWPRSGRLLPHYTASIDAALTLVPEGWDYWHVERRDTPFGKRTAEATIHNGELFMSGRHRGVDIFAHTPALALCIAALRAREEAHAAA